jgi:transposase-like protein
MPTKRRTFSDRFKAQVVLDLISGSVSQAELCRKHKLHPQLVGRWKTAVLENLHTLFQEDPRASQDQLRIAELEQLIGRQAYEIEILKKVSRLLPGPPSRNGELS